MRRSHLALCGLTAMALLAMGGPAAADTEAETAEGVVADVGKISDAGPVVMGAVMDPKDLAAAEVSMPLGDGFDSEAWELDETLGKPVFSIADRGLAAKGYPNGLQGIGVDTGAVEQGLSLPGGSAPAAGGLNSMPVVSGVMTGINDLIP